VLMEAVCSGTPVLASRIDGNVGLLGENYAGYFEPGDAPALARALLALRSPGGAQLTKLREQCAARAHLFDPQAERAALMRWVQELGASAQ
jgi:glycosyltransferase involved in cell wall biosynthesis